MQEFKFIINCEMRYPCCQFTVDAPGMSSFHAEGFKCSYKWHVCICGNIKGDQCPGGKCTQLNTSSKT